MPREDFDQQLHVLQQEVESLAGFVGKSIQRAVDSLKRRDLVSSQEVINDDDYIDGKRFEIEDRCVDLIATQQPMARDLRAIVSLLHIVVELERMGDYAEGIAKISLAMLNRDMIKANHVCQVDDEVDALYDQVYRELLLFMIQDPTTIQRATYLLWVAHDLERIADRATNIAERVIFLVTGRMVEVNASRY